MKGSTKKERTPKKASTLGDGNRQSPTKTSGGSPGNLTDYELTKQDTEGHVDDIDEFGRIKYRTEYVFVSFEAMQTIDNIISVIEEAMEAIR